jgi:hypothetical protein
VWRGYGRRLLGKCVKRRIVVANGEDMNRFGFRARAIWALAGLAVMLPTASAVPAAAAADRGAVTASAFTPPTNLRVRSVAPTSVVFEWDHALEATPGCTLRIFLYAVYRDGQFVGWTHWGSPVGAVFNLRPGTTYRLHVQGRDNCSGQLTPLSQPLFVTTPRN